MRGHGNRQFGRDAGIVIHGFLERFHVRDQRHKLLDPLEGLRGLVVAVLGRR